MDSNTLQKTNKRRDSNKIETILYSSRNRCIRSKNEISDPVKDDPDMGDLIVAFATDIMEQYDRKSESSGSTHGSLGQL